MKLSSDIGVTLVCPACREEVVHVPESYVCRSAECRRSYPIVEGIPKFLNDDATVLSPDEWREIVPDNGESSSNS